TYDNQRRLTLETIGGASINYAGNGSSLSGYDAVGNRRSRISTVTGVAGTPANINFDVNDRIDNDATPSSISTWFDANGNTTTPDLNGDGTPDSGYSYSYDAENRLITSSGDGKTVNNSYDANGS